jgi:hypothetical protein
MPVSHTWMYVAALWCATTAPAAPAAPASPEATRTYAASLSRVRALDHIASYVLDDGLRRSPTLRRLVADLQRTDVVVYVHMTAQLPGGCDGALRFVSGASPLRYLRASIQINATHTEMIALVAHELQHALEVAAATEVRSLESFEAFFRRTGISGSSGAWVDSAAARQTGSQVRRELGS